MGCHICTDEILAIFAIFGAVRYLPAWARARWAARHRQPTCRHPGGHPEFDHDEEE